MNAGPPPAGNGALIPDEEAARWEEAKQLRGQQPTWLVIWVPRAVRFHAYRLSGNQGGTPLAAQTIDDLAIQIGQAEQAPRRPPGRSARGQGGQRGEPGTAEVTRT